MTRGSPILFLLAASCGGVASRVEEVPPELRRPALVIPPVADRWPHPVQGLQPGEWARYREGGMVVMLAVVGKEGDDLWIEAVVEGEPAQASAALVGPDGAVRKAFYGEISKEGRTAVSPQPVVQSAAVPPARLTEVSREAGEEAVTVGGRELRCRRIRVRLEDLDGRLREETTLWHPEVPRLRGGEAGGLVRGPGVELVAFGRDAKPLLDRPR